MAEEIHEKTVTLTREAEGIYVAHNEAGAQVRFGHNSGGFGSVELLIAAILGCSSTDADMMTSRRAEPEHFEVTAVADKVSGGDDGNILRNIRLSFDLRFPEGEGGDKARARVGAALKTAHDKTCTVSRTVEHGAQVTMIDVNHYDAYGSALPGSRGPMLRSLANRLIGSVVKKRVIGTWIRLPRACAYQPDRQRFSHRVQGERRMEGTPLRRTAASATAWTPRQSR